MEVLKVTSLRKMIVKAIYQTLRSLNQKHLIRNLLKNLQNLINLRIKAQIVKTKILKNAIEKTEMNLLNLMSLCQIVMKTQNFQMRVLIVNKTQKLRG